MENVKKFNVKYFDKMQNFSPKQISQSIFYPAYFRPGD